MPKKSAPPTAIPEAVEDGDILLGKSRIVSFLNTISSGWTARKVKHARETKALPIRVKRGIGMYASKAQLLAALFDPDTLLPQGT